MLAFEVNQENINQLFTNTNTLKNVYTFSFSSKISKRKAFKFTENFDSAYLDMII